MGKKLEAADICWRSWCWLRGVVKIVVGQLAVVVFVTFVTFTNTLFGLKGTIPVARKAD